jgi:hypothetical protein
MYSAMIPLARGARLTGRSRYQILGWHLCAVRLHSAAEGFTGGAEVLVHPHRGLRNEHPQVPSFPSCAW